VAVAADELQPLSGPLARIHERLWDPSCHLERMAPGVTPGVDLSGLGLHSVRESALGAYLDLQLGVTDRAIATLRAVLDHQYEAPDRPWDGTFRVTAEQADPPGAQAVEWLHYDPNWRQFLGTVLMVTVLDHGDRLPDDLSGLITAAVVRCALGESEGRIPEWYTNPNLLHAWVSAHAGVLVGSPDLVVAGLRRAARTVTRLEQLGDVDEYNSPTYDGVDLIAAALWIVHPPAPEFVGWGRLLLDRLCGRLSLLVDPELGTVCGPHARAYGLSMERYVSLLGLWLHCAGLEGAVPAVLDPSTDHVHDLYFAPLIERLAAGVEPPWRLSEVTDERRHVQRFGGIDATSVLRPGRSVGWASGPVPGFAADQYVPFVVHCRRPDGGVAHVALRPGPGVESTLVVEVDAHSHRIEATTGGRPAAISIECAREGDVAVLTGAAAAGPVAAPVRVCSAGGGRWSRETSTRRTLTAVDPVVEVRLGAVAGP